MYTRCQLSSHEGNSVLGGEHGLLRWELRNLHMGVGGGGGSIIGNWGHTHMMFAATAQADVINMVPPLIS